MLSIVAIKFRRRTPNPPRCKHPHRTCGPARDGITHDEEREHDRGDDADPAYRKAKIESLPDIAANVLRGVNLRT